MKPKKNTPLVFFFCVLCVFFLREVIFYGGFILKEEHNQKKKKIAFISVCPAFSQLPGNSIAALKPKRLPQEPRERGAFTEPSSCFAACLQPPPGAPGTRRQLCNLLCHLPRPWAGSRPSSDPAESHARPQPQGDLILPGPSCACFFFFCIL